MRNPKEILVTTTSSVEGLSIKQYIKPISAHVVAGTNFFSDFFASFSDVFGGRSQTYQRQLSSIYTEAVETLKRSAYEVGANCILGLKVDLDEISGKGKSMFMITATGTAVIIESLSKSLPKVTLQEKLDLISSEKMIELRKRKKIIQSAMDRKLELNDSNWEFITETIVSEISNEILDIVSEIYNQMYEGKEKLYQQLLNYMMALPEDHRTGLLYDYLMNEKSNPISSVIFKLIKDLMIFEPNKLQQYMTDNNEDIKRKALELVVMDKLFYTKEDINTFENLIQTISKQYSKKGELSTQKKLLSSKEKDIWICQCNAKNGIDSKYCNNCNMDIYGFLADQTNPEDAIKKLTEDIEMIRINVA